MNNPLGAPCTVCLDSKLSIISVQCRICYENDKSEALIAPCNCKGTVAFVHQSCLERWLAESNTTTCELCHVVFQTERAPKYTSGQSIWNWFRSYRTPGGFSRGVRSDIIACTVITPVAIIITYACLFSSEYYNQKKFVLMPAARWTSISLLIMIALMLMGYYLWVYSVIRMHSRMWYNWWQRDCVVRYIPRNNMDMLCETPSEVDNPNNTPISENNTPTSENNTSTSDTLAVEILIDEDDKNIKKNIVKSEIKTAEANPENAKSTERFPKLTKIDLDLSENDRELIREIDIEKSVENVIENPVDQTAVTSETFQNEDVGQSQVKESQVQII